MGNGETAGTVGSDIITVLDLFCQNTQNSKNIVEWTEWKVVRSVENKVM